MQFLVLGYDGRDPDAASRRQEARSAHLAAIGELKGLGHFLFGGALLNDKGKMVGSAIVFEFEDRAALEASLAKDPYITGKVWERVEIQGFVRAAIE